MNDLRRNWRPPTATERAIFDRLLTADFRGKEQIAQQLGDCVVDAIDEYGSLTIAPNAGTVAAVDTRVPVEGCGLDVDGTPVEFLLMVRDGLVYELQIYRADGLPLIALPAPKAIEVSVLPPPSTERR